MKYAIATSLNNDAEIRIMTECGLGLVADYVHGEMRSTMLYSLAESQKCRDELIKRGCAPMKIRVQYHTGGY